MVFTSTSKPHPTNDLALYIKLTPSGELTSVENININSFRVLASYMQQQRGFQLVGYVNDRNGVLVKSSNQPFHRLPRFTGDTSTGTQGRLLDNYISKLNQIYDGTKVDNPDNLSWYKLKDERLKKAQNQARIDEEAVRAKKDEATKAKTEESNAERITRCIDKARENIKGYAESYETCCIGMQILKCSVIGRCECLYAEFLVEK